MTPLYMGRDISQLSLIRANTIFDKSFPANQPLITGLIFWKMTSSRMRNPVFARYIVIYSCCLTHRWLAATRWRRLYKNTWDGVWLQVISCKKAPWFVANLWETTCNFRHAMRGTGAPNMAFGVPVHLSWQTRPSMRRNTLSCYQSA